MMSLNKNIKVFLLLTFTLFISVSCDEQLTELNVDPLGVDPSQGNPNQVMTNVLTGAAMSYLDLGYGEIAGVMQHTQKDGWFSGHNHYAWDAKDWAGWYGLLRNNNYMMERAEALDFDFHMGVGHTMRGFLFGTIADLWGDAPYSNALQGNTGETELMFPEYDSQETIYQGVISDLEEAASIFSSADNTGVAPSYDVFYGGDIEKWHKLANSLLLRYYMRVSDKMPAMAKSGIEGLAANGMLITSSADDATMSFIGASSSDSWPANTTDGGSNFRRIKPGQPFLDALMEKNDPRMSVWIAPVHVQWVPDFTLPTKTEEFIRKNGEIMEGVTSMLDQQFLDEIAAGNVFTRRYNPDLIGPDDQPINDDMYVGVPPGLFAPDAWNYNPTPGQNVQNQHVSQLAPKFRDTEGEMLLARIISAAEVHFILAEAALEGYSVGSAEMHYNDGIKSSLEAWGVGDQYDDYITEPDVVFDGTLQQVIEQKWIASWTTATEAWFDFRRTGYPELVPGPASEQPVLPVRYMYGNDEIAYNPENLEEGRSSLTITEYSGPRQEDSQWSKPWIIQDTNKPW